MPGDPPTSEHTRSHHVKTKRVPRETTTPANYAANIAAVPYSYAPPAAHTQAPTQMPPPPQPYYRPYESYYPSVYHAPYGTPYPYGSSYVAPMQLAPISPPPSKVPMPQQQSTVHNPVETPRYIAAPPDRTLSKPVGDSGAARKPALFSTRTGLVGEGKDYLDGMTHASTIVDPLHPRDVTLHMSLDLALDLEGFLEANARLRRLGQFKSAIAHFETYLAHSSENLYVLTQFAQCLLDARAFGHLARLAKKHKVQTSLDETAINWELVLRVASKLSGTELVHREDPSTRYPRETVVGGYIDDATDTPDSTQMQNLSLAVRLCKDSFVPHRSWGTIYQHLLAEERVWEFKDILLALEEQEGLEDAASMLLHDRYSEWDFALLPVVEDLVRDWGSLTVDESCYFGGLDLFASLSVACAKGPISSKRREAMELCLETADKYAEHLSRLSVENLKTRPFLMWMMAKSYLEASFDEQTDADFIVFKGSSRGTFDGAMGIFPYEEMPLYAPTEDEMPEWRPRCLFMTDEILRTTEVILAAAEELGDVPLQVGCLQQLAVRGSAEPRAHLERVLKLWKSSGNRQSYLRVLLFHYLLVRDEAEKAALRRDILEHGECSDTGFTEYARCMILRALTPHEIEKSRYRRRAKSAHHVLDYDSSDGSVSSRSDVYISDSDASNRRRSRRTRYSVGRTKPATIVTSHRHGVVVSSDDEEPPPRHARSKAVNRRREREKDDDLLEKVTAATAKVAREQAAKPPVTKEKRRSKADGSKADLPSLVAETAVGAVSDDMITYPDTAHDSGLAAHVEDKSDESSQI